MGFSKLGIFYVILLLGVILLTLFDFSLSNPRAWIDVVILIVLAVLIYRQIKSDE